jgi:hypothetical protein
VGKNRPALLRAPLPEWGAPLLVGAPEQVAHFDAVNGRQRRSAQWAMRMGWALAAAGVAWVLLDPSHPPGIDPLMGGAAPGFLLVLVGYWFFVYHGSRKSRLWGLYENGVVCPYLLGPQVRRFVPWSDVRVARVRHLQMPARVGDELRLRWLLRFEGQRGVPYRFRQVDLELYFGLSFEEAASLEPAILDILRGRLPPEKVVVEAVAAPPA